MESELSEMARSFIDFWCWDKLKQWNGTLYPLLAITKRKILIHIIHCRKFFIQINSVGR